MTAFWSVNLLAANAALGIAGMVLGAAVIVATFVVGRTGAQPNPSTPRTGGGRPPGSRTFLVAVFLEVAIALVAIVVLGRSGHGDFIMPTIALVVALHFYVFLITQRLWIHVLAGTVGALGSLSRSSSWRWASFDTTTGRAIAGTALGLCTLGYGIAFLRLIAARATASAPQR